MNPLAWRRVPSALPGDAAALCRQGPKGDREAQSIARRDAVLPLVARLARKQVGGSRRHLEIGAPESRRDALSEAQGRRGVERKPDHLLEDVAVAVPADAGAGVVACQQ